jgi:hypothetical protein
MHRSIRPIVVVVAAVLSLPAMAATAVAHGDEAAGALTVTIGFGTEPAYASHPNSVQVLLRHGGDGVINARDLTAEVSFGDASTTVPLEPHFGPGWGTPGDYRAWFVPTEPGTYTFHVTGTADGEEIDIEMTSGPQTFSDVLPLRDAMFPPVDAPGTDVLAERIEQESARTAGALASAEEAAAAASDAAGAARSTAVIAIVIALVAAAAASVTLMRGRRGVTP